MYRSLISTRIQFLVLHLFSLCGLFELNKYISPKVFFFQYIVLLLLQEVTHYHFRVCIKDGVGYDGQRGIVHVDYLVIVGNLGRKYSPITIVRLYICRTICLCALRLGLKPHCCRSE